MRNSAVLRNKYYFVGLPWMDIIAVVEIHFISPQLTEKSKKNKQIQSQKDAYLKFASYTPLGKV